MEKIYIIKGKRKMGPFSINEVYQLAGTKKIDSQTILWFKGMEEEKQAGVLLPHLFKSAAPIRKQVANISTKYRVKSNKQADVRFTLQK